MTTSGSIDFNSTGADIIKRALRLANVIEQEEEPEGGMTVTALRALNAMVKSWQKRGRYLWKMEDATLFLTLGQRKYKLGGTTTDHATLTRDVVQTTLSAAAAASATALSVTSATGIVADDQIGIILDSGAFHWTTVASVSGTTVNIDTALPSAAASGNRTYSYTTALVRPLRIPDDEVRRIDSADQEIPILTFSRNEYFATPNKDASGKPTQAYYDPKLGSGELYLWPVGDTVEDRIAFTCFLPIEDFDVTSNDPDFPSEWLTVLDYGLACEMCVEYGTPQKTYDRVKEKFIVEFEEINAFDAEPESVYFGVENTGRWG